MNFAKHKLLDATTLKNYMACPRQYFFRHVLNWNKERISPALFFGLAWHSGLEHAYKWLKENPGKRWTEEIIQEAQAVALTEYVDKAPPDALMTETLRTPGKLRSLLGEYFAQYPRETFKVLAVEEPFALGVTFGGYTTAAFQKEGGHLVIPQDGRAFSWIGKMDVIVQWDPGITTIDHKTTREMGVSFGEQWNPDTQMTGYVTTAGIMYGGEKIHGAMINAAQVAKTKNGFMRIPTTRSKKQLEAHHKNITTWASRMATDSVFPMNHTSCNDYGGCPYKEVCIKYPDIVDKPRDMEPEYGFELDEWNPVTRLEEQ